MMYQKKKHFDKYKFSSHLYELQVLSLGTNRNRKPTAIVEAPNKRSCVFSTLEETVFSMAEIERKQNYTPKS